jgi:pimeloyl-ACP methyl ester carboxylesterase
MIVRRLACRPLFLAVLLSTWAAGQSTSTTSVQDREQYLQNLQSILPPDPYFDAWLKKSHALPPDFGSFPKNNNLPDPLKFLDGRQVLTVGQWPARRQEIEDLSQKYVWGTFPPKPKIDRAIVLDEKHEAGYTVRNLRLEFGPESKGTMRVRVVVPDGNGPFPAFISDNLFGWSPSVIRRGYISAGYAANDSMDDADALAQLYPNYDFALLSRRAWAASLVVDYLATLPHIDMKHIAIFGYSRGGKMIAIAAAMDTRITAVIAGSTGVGGVLPWRASGERGFGEGIETTTRQFSTWFAPQLRFFSGREDRLPVDGNLLAAMIAPRSLLMEWGNNDQVSNTWGNEQTYYSALKVYKLLGAPNALGTMRVPGFHGANDEEACLDWLDIQFGRSNRTWTNNLIFQWTWEKWRDNSKESIELTRYPDQGGAELLKSGNGTQIASTGDWEKKSAETRRSVLWMLGTEPPRMSSEEVAAGRRRRPVPAPGAPNPGQVTPDLPAWVISNGGIEYGWLDPEKNQTASRHVIFGGNLAGDLYYPKDSVAGKKLPLVIWLHGYSYPLGYMWVYHEDLHPILALVRAGYAVLAFDQSGFGSRLTETGPFYDRYPKWSHMGRLVEDVNSAVDSLAKDTLVDPERIYLFGYSLGGTVALYAAALNPQVKGVVSIAGFTPMRTDTLEKGTGGVARYSNERGMIPRLGFFVGHETQIPYDFQDLLGMIAPRPVLVVQPKLDRDATPEDVNAAVQQAKQVYSLYGATNKLEISEPWDYNRLPNKTQDAVIEWMNSNLH